MVSLSVLQAAALLPWANPTWTEEIPASLRRRDPRIWQMVYGCAQRALSAVGVRPNSIVVATALGALDETANFLDGVFTDGFGSPRHFIASVHNSLAGKLAQELKVPGPNLTLCDGTNSFASAVASCGLLSKADFPVLLIAADENIELLDRIVPHLSIACRRTLTDHKKEGALAFVLDSEPAIGKPRVRSSGPLFIGLGDPDEVCKNVAASMNAEFSGKVFLPSECRGSFLSVPLAAFDCLNQNMPGTTLYGSFSPSSKSVSLVELCL